MYASGVQLQQVPLLGVGQFRLFSAEGPFCLGDLHAFACSSANQIGFDYVDKSQKSRAGMVCGMAPVGRWGWTLLCSELVDDVFRISE